MLDPLIQWQSQDFAIVQDLNHLQLQDKLGIELVHQIESDHDQGLLGQQEHQSQSDLSWNPYLPSTRQIE